MSSGISRDAKATSGLDAGFLAVGFFCSLALALLTLGVSIVEMTRLEHTTLERADHSQYATYHLGDVGEQLARLRAHVALGLEDSASRFSARAAPMAGVKAALHEALDALPQELDPEMMEQWDALQPRIVHLEQSYANAAQAITDGRAAEAAAILEREAATAADVRDDLDALQESHQAFALHQLRSVHGDTTRIVRLEAILTIFFLTGMIVIWMLMARALIRRRQLIAEYTDRLEAANDDLDAFAGRVSHDLRNALGSVVMVAPLLRASSEDPERIREISDRLEHSSRESLRLIDALLAFSRSSQAFDAHEAASVREAVDNVLEQLQPQIDALHVTVDADRVPDVHVRCTAGLLHTVVLNLCSNAVKFLEDREDRRVWVSAHVEDSYGLIEVKDTGPGIPKDAQDKIFEPFYRAASCQAPGSGIGLATVRRIVEARGGRITVQSTEGRGSCFQVWLPLQPGNRAHQAQQPSRPPDEPTRAQS